MSGTLYIVATPIGNLGDFSERGIKTLREVDLVAAEDTRNTSILLKHFDIHTPLSANHKFNEHEVVGRFVSMLAEGKNIAVVSDAGTPCVNDPGFVLCEAAARAGIPVIGIPGACAAVTAVSVSGLPAGSFRFSGFFPREKKEIGEVIKKIKDSETELYIFYESPRRIEDTLKVLASELPTAKLALCNDLTKLHERIYRGTPGEVLSEISANPNSEKGEYAMCLYYEQTEPLGNAGSALEAPTLEAQLVDIVVRENCSMKEAISVLASKVDVSKKEIYQASLNLKNIFGGC